MDSTSTPGSLANENTPEDAPAPRPKTCWSSAHKVVEIAPSEMEAAAELYRGDRQSIAKHFRCNVSLVHKRLNYSVKLREAFMRGCARAEAKDAESFAAGIDGPDELAVLRAVEEGARTYGEVARASGLPTGKVGVVAARLVWADRLVEREGMPLNTLHPKEAK